MNKNEDNISSRLGSVANLSKDGTTQVVTTQADIFLTLPELFQDLPDDEFLDLTGFPATSVGCPACWATRNAGLF